VLEWSDVLLDGHELHRPDLRALDHRHALDFYGTILVEPDRQGRAGICLIERERIEHMPGSRGHASHHDAHHGQDRDLVDHHLLGQSQDAQRVREYTALVREMAGELHRYVAARVDPARAEDAVSEVLLVVWRRWDVLPTEHDARRAWTYEVAKRTTQDTATRQQRQRRLLLRVAASHGGLEPEQPGDLLAAQEAVAHLLQHLPEGQAQALRLTAVDGLSAQEAAQVLGISATAITTRLCRAREALRTWISNSEGRQYG